MKTARALCCLPLLLLLSARQSPGYSVLTHEAIIDSSWDKDIKPQLQARFPNASEDDLRKAHAFAYGGCIIQDMGYYPFGSKLFSDLVHYVRSGDFVAALFEQAQSLNDLAFAYGALAHYASDINGHRLAVNRAVPMEYPKLKRRYGNVVTYADSPSSHIKTEFGFDVLQVARGRYAPQGYHDFIGFDVARETLDKAFFKVYGLHLKDIFATEDLAFGTYRHTVSSLIPKATKVAWKLKSKEIAAAQPGMTQRKFLYNISRSSYSHEWKDKYHKTGVGTWILATIIRFVPKVGPFKALDFEPPAPGTEQLFELSFNRTLDVYRGLIPKASAGRLQISDLNLDTGEPVVAGQYVLADRAYAQLVRKLAGRDVADVPEEMRRNILEFYGHGSATVASSEKAHDWSKTQAAINRLKAQARPNTPR
jgi:hypothetical protein